MDTPQLQPLDESLWMGVTGSIVAQLTKTILCMQETSSRGGVNLDRALHGLLTKLSTDANNFIGSLNEFCQAVAETCSCSGTHQIEPTQPVICNGPCSPCCSCYSSESEELDCESLDCACDVRPSVASKGSACMEKGCQVCIIEEEFTEVSTYSIDPVTKKLKISKVEEYSQYAKCTSMKNQAIQCTCSGDENGQAEGDGITSDVNKSINAEGPENESREGPENKSREGSENKSREATENLNEKTTETDGDATIKSKKKCIHGKKCCKCEKRDETLSIDEELDEVTAKSSSQSKCSKSGDQLSSSKHHKKCCKCDKLKESSSVLDEFAEATENSSIKSSKLSSKSFSQSKGDVDEVSSKVSKTSSPSRHSASIEQMSAKLSTSSKHSTGQEQVSLKSSKPMLKELSPCTSATCSGQNSSLILKRSKEGKASLTSSPLSIIKETASATKQTEQEEVELPSPLSVVAEQEKSVHSKRSSKEERRSSPPSVAGIPEQELSVHTKRSSKEEKRSSPPSVTGIPEQESSVHTKRSSKEEQRSLRSSITTEQVPPTYTKRSSKGEYRSSLSSSTALSQRAPSLQTKRSSKEEEEAYVGSKRGSADDRSYVPTTCSVIEEGQGSSSKRVSKTASTGGSPLTSKRSSREAQTVPRSGSLVKVEAELQTGSRHSSRDVQTISRASSAIKTEPEVASKRSSKEKPSSASQGTVSERKSPVQLKQKDAKEGCSFTCCTCGAKIKQERANSRTQTSMEEKPATPPPPPPPPVHPSVAKTQSFGCGTCQEDDPDYLCCTCDAERRAKQRPSSKQKIKEERRSVSVEAGMETEPLSSVSTLEESTRKSSKDVYTSASETDANIPGFDSETDEGVLIKPEERFSSVSSATEPEFVSAFERKSKDRSSVSVSGSKGASVAESIQLRGKGSRSVAGSVASTAIKSEGALVSETKLEEEYLAESASEHERKSLHSVKGEDLEKMSAASIRDRVASQKSATKSESIGKPPSVPQSSASIAQSAASIPQSAASIPQSAASIPQSAASVPQSAASIPQSAASIPQSAASVPQSAASVPQSAASVPQSAASVPQSLSSIPDSKLQSKEGRLASRSFTSATAKSESISLAESKRRSKESVPTVVAKEQSKQETLTSSLEGKQKSIEEQSIAPSSIPSKQQELDERALSTSITGAKPPSTQDYGSISLSEVEKASREARLSVPRSVKSAEPGKDQRASIASKGSSRPASGALENLKDTTSRVSGSKPPSLKELLQAQKRLSTAAAQCICPPAPVVDKCICTSHSQNLVMPPLENNRINTWVKRLSDTEQTLATLRSKIENFSTGIHHEKSLSPSRPPKQTHTRRECSPISGLNLHYDITCSCPEDHEHHHYPRPPSPRTPPRPNSPSVIKQIPLMPPQAIPIQPGIIDNSRRRFEQSCRKCKTHNSNSCSCGPK